MIQIKLMKTVPTVLHNGSEIKIEGVQRGLFRLLVLYGGDVVTKDAVASLTDTEVMGVGSKVRYLREALGPLGDRIVNDRGAGYRFDLAGCEVDAAIFRTEVEAVRRRYQDWETVGSMDSVTALAEAERLNRVLSLWEKNPADELPFEEGLTVKYDDFKEELESRLTFALLHTRRDPLIREAISQLEGDIRRGDADTRRWRLLLLAYHAIGSSSKISKTWERISEAHPKAVPTQLEQTFGALHDAHFRNPLSLDPASSEIAANEQEAARTDANMEHTLPAICKLLGITTASHLRLQDSQLTPIACIKRTQRRLWFSGVLASKWVTDPFIRKQFDNLLSKLDRERGEARFMMINPNGDGYRRLYELRQGNLSTESIEPLMRLAAAHPSLEVRFFDSLPSFRIVIIDDDIVSFSPYRLAADAYLATERGWEAPHVVLDPVADYPLAEAFELLFRETWNGAVRLGDLS